MCMSAICIVPCLGWYVNVRVCPPVLTLRGFCVMSSRLVDSRLSFMATYRRLPSSSGSRECRSPATRGSVSRRPFWISSDRGRKTKDDVRDSNQWRLPSNHENVLGKSPCWDRQNGYFASTTCCAGLSCQCAHTKLVKSTHHNHDVREENNFN